MYAHTILCVERGELYIKLIMTSFQSHTCGNTVSMLIIDHSPRQNHGTLGYQIIVDN